MLKHGQAKMVVGGCSSFMEPLNRSILNYLEEKKPPSTALTGMRKLKVLNEKMD